MLSEYCLEDGSTLLEELYWNSFQQIVTACWMVHWVDTYPRISTYAQEHMA